ncbi:MAG: hypothetical protein BAJALOKI1v1_190015 [Promethearchaeota archaeon]|nr:MAG: hypothetical protein BAJALOKI1v1_190015 [Candidatus Lokiarchaeota archaeon]
MEPIIIKNRVFRLLGCVYYGDPFHFHSKKEWTYENEIGLLWKRFGGLIRKYSILLDKINANPEFGYEVHLEPEEYRETKQYYVIVGIEVNNIEEIPLEMFIKILPRTDYILVTTKVNSSNTEIQDLYDEWIPKNNYQNSYPYLIQAYEQKRYFGLENPASEIDWYIPIKPVEK